ncbi:MAG: M20/M25/M40 family metallo-hydrolase [Bacteroidetes bacterium]|nr:M20/M25/M40 family metallo-hydrolase [Bacteroidota bacterium]
MRFVLIALFLSPFSLIAVDDDLKLIKRLQQHIEFLAHDSLEGRATGSKGEALAYKYIIKEFTEIGLLPKGDGDSYLSDFEFTAGRVYGKDDLLKINDITLKVDSDYFLIMHSGNGIVSGELVDVGFGISAPKAGHDDYKGKTDLQGKIFLMELSSPDGIHPHSKYADHSDIRTKLNLAKEKGAAAVLIINTDDDLRDPVIDFSIRITPTDIPAAFIHAVAWDKLKDKKKWQVELVVDMKKVKKTGHNVAGYLDNGAENTIVIGAHYDHLGYGSHQNSLHHGPEAVHNGADDNASGTAAVIELARKIKTENIRSNNYLFLAFSGEEMGLYGSKSFVKEPSIELARINYMINYDMVGRLDPTQQKIMINGAGTSELWKEALENLKVKGIEIKTGESGLGPSDHTSFYLENIPVLHFFTGTHSDYHKPSDDADKINYDGIVSVMKVTLDVIGQLDSKGKLNFIKTKDADNKNAPRFTVTLGILPDYMFDGAGMKIDGVSEGKPASKAGIQKNDIVIKMGDIEVVDMMSYMKALGKFKRGETTKVQIRRNEEILELDVTFQ